MDEHTPTTDEQLGARAATLDAVLEYLRERLEEVTEAVSQYTADAAALLARGDFSGGATYSHRAHQQRLIRDELRAVLALVDQ